MPSYTRRQLYNVAAEFGRDLLARHTLRGHLAAAQAAGNVLSGLPLPTAIRFIVPSRPTSGQKAPRLSGLNQCEHAVPGVANPMAGHNDSVDGLAVIVAGNP